MTAARTITFTLNGAPVTADVKPHHNLVELLQTQFGLTGARESCGQGLCGCCTVLVNGRAVSGCLYLASFVDGAEVIDRREPRHAARSSVPVQEAFIEAGAFQCGYCTPGFILMVDATARRASRSGRRPDQALPHRQSLPLRHLSGGDRGGEARGEEAQGRRRR